MMKKIFLTILTMILSINAYANIHIDGKTARTIILEHIDQAHQLEALKEYNVQLKATGNSTMSVSGLYKVCAAAGWNISKSEDKYKCNNFVQALVEKSDYKYYEVCGNGKGKSGGTEHCIDNVFYSLIGGTKVTKLQADGLCKEYAHVKYNDDIECSTDTRKGTINPLNDYVKCTSKLNPVYYEFKFDDITESVDFTIQQSVQESLCKIYGLKFQKSIGTPDANGNLNMTTPYCETKDTNLCKKISESAKRFNYYAEIRTGNFYGSGYCGLYQTNKIYSQRDLKTAYGIANDIFYNNLIQIQGSKDIKAGIKQYIADKIKPEQIIKFQCNDNPIQIGSIRGKSDNDDVLTCYINDNQIDFVFDDLSEAMKLYRMAGQEAFSCVVNGGTYTGKRCVNLNEEQCKKIAQSTFLAEDCPECKTAYWDGNICTLPNASVANALQKGLNISLIVGGAVLNVVITVQTGGTSTAVGGGLLFVETVGSAIELGTEIRMDLAADKFFVESAQCKDKNCAGQVISKHFQRLANFIDRLTDTEIEAVDKEMTRLFELIPAEELFTEKVFKEINSQKIADNTKGFFDIDSWETEQIIQAMGIAIQFTSLVAGITKAVFVKIYAKRYHRELSRTISNYKKMLKEAQRSLTSQEKVLLRNEEIAYKTIGDFYDASQTAEGRRWIELYEQYAPKNQSLEDFKKIGNNDLDIMEEKVKHMMSRQEIQESQNLARLKQLQLINNTEWYSDDVYKEFKQELRKEQLKTGSGNFDKWTTEQQNLMREIAKQDDIIEGGTTSYSTFNLKASKINKKYEPQVEALDAEYARIRNAFQTKNTSLSPQDFDDAFKASPEYLDWKTRSNLTAEQYQLEMAEAAPLPTLQKIANERADVFNAIVENSDEFKTKLTPEVWSALFDDERADVARKILHEYAYKTNTTYADVRLDYNTKSAGYYIPGTNKITYNPNSDFNYGGDLLMGTTTHEHGHMLDYFMPNEGSVGEQLMKQPGKMYTSKGDSYYSALTEQSSYAISEQYVPNENVVLSKAHNKMDRVKDIKQDMKTAKYDVDNAAQEDVYNTYWGIGKEIDRKVLVPGVGVEAVGLGGAAVANEIKKNNKLTKGEQDAK